MSVWLKYTTVIIAIRKAISTPHMVGHIFSISLISLGISAVPFKLNPIYFLKTIFFYILNVRRNSVQDDLEPLVLHIASCQTSLTSRFCTLTIFRSLSQIPSKSIHDGDKGDKGEVPVTLK